MVLGNGAIVQYDLTNFPFLPRGTQLTVVASGGSGERPQVYVQFEVGRVVYTALLEPRSFAVEGLTERAPTP